MSQIESATIKQLILNSAKPLLFKNMLNWPIMQWSLQDWTDALKEEKMTFRRGNLKRAQDPHTTELIQGDIIYFMKHLNDEDKWLYFDYKHLQEYLINVKEIRDSIDWTSLGFPEIQLEDSTIWIGSKGAHTPCHQDTYGFNLVHQIYGRKLWLLFPPDVNLYPTRIPYEESSIFSKLNFFSPTVEKFKNVGNCHKVILGPGDVLFVPHKWWHYVENLETAISINTWIPMEEDNSERLEESIVQFLVKLLIDSDIFDETTRKVVMNPNMEDELSYSTASKSLNILDETRKICLGISKKTWKTDSTTSETKIFYRNDDELSQRFDNVTNIPRISNEEFYMFLLNQNSRFSGSEIIELPHVCNGTLTDTMDAILHPEVITLIKEKVLAKQEGI